MKATICGVYKITCKPTGQVYIGASHDIETRFYNHLWSLRHGTHGNRILTALYNQYGGEAFELEVLEECRAERITLAICENKWIKGYQGPLINLFVSEKASVGPMVSHASRKKEAVSEHLHNSSFCTPCTHFVKHAFIIPFFFKRQLSA